MAERNVAMDHLHSQIVSCRYLLLRQAKHAANSTGASGCTGSSQSRCCRQATPRGLAGVCVGVGYRAGGTRACLLRGLGPALRAGRASAAPLRAGPAGLGVGGGHAWLCTGYAWQAPGYPSGVCGPHLGALDDRDGQLGRADVAVPARVVVVGSFLFRVTGHTGSGIVGGISERVRPFGVIRQRVAGHARSRVT
jgi:hypothetical protein